MNTHQGVILCEGLSLVSDSNMTLLVEISDANFSSFKLKRFHKQTELEKCLNHRFNLVPTNEMTYVLRQNLGFIAFETINAYRVLLYIYIYIYTLKFVLLICKPNVSKPRLQLL